MFFFFFQAEDGIRDLTVTGVQTCALPICEVPQRAAADLGPGGADEHGRLLARQATPRAQAPQAAHAQLRRPAGASQPERGLRDRSPGARSEDRPDRAGVQTGRDPASAFGIEFRPMRLSLDWMNLFGGLTGSQITSVIVVAVIFTIASGLVLLSLIVFGVRAGLMAPTYSTRLPAASDVELGAFLGGAALGMVSILLMTFLGFAENDLDNPLFLPLAVGPILLGGLFFLTGAGLAFRTIRRRRSPA